MKAVLPYIVLFFFPTEAALLAQTQFEACASDENEASFTIVLDNNSAENGWSLVCDTSTTPIWDVAAGSLPSADVSYITNTACVSKSAYCEFTLVDTSGDGLVGDYGYYFLTYGATTIAASSEEETSEFSERRYCFGVGCDEPPLEVDNFIEDEDDEEEGCTAEEEEAGFTIVLDAHADETGWSLVCDDAITWNAPVGSLSDPEGTFITQTACVAKNSTCEFTLIDTAGDGLIGDNGWYALTYGATTISVSSEEESTEFTVRSYCFGVECNEPPLEVDDEDEDDEEEGCTPEEEEAGFTIVLDAHADETGWSLVCDDAVTWNTPAGSLSDPEGTFITQTACVAKTSTCEFTLIDTAGDGLIGDDGWYALTYGATTIAVSSEEESTEFTERSYCFGVECNEPPLEVDDEDEDDEQSEGCASEDEEAIFTIVLDANSDETGWSLVCDDNILWDTTPGILRDPAGTTIAQTACVSPTSSCEFILMDTAGNGLSEDVSSYTLTFGSTMVASSSDEDTAEFTERRYCFGSGCDQNEGDGPNPLTGKEFSDDKNGAKVWIIIGSALSGLVVVLLALMVLVRRRSQQEPIIVEESKNGSK